MIIRANNAQLTGKIEFIPPGRTLLRQFTNDVIKHFTGVDMERDKAKAKAISLVQRKMDNDKLDREHAAIEVLTDYFALEAMAEEEEGKEPKGTKA